MAGVEKPKDQQPCCFICCTSSSRGHTYLATSGMKAIECGIPQKVQFTLGLFASTQDRICQPCLTKVLKFHAFKTLAMKNRYKLVEVELHHLFFLYIIYICEEFVNITNL